jgi:hypothetical protein
MIVKALPISDVPAWLHPLVRDPYDLHEARANDAVKQNLRGPAHLCGRFAGKRISQM